MIVDVAFITVNYNTCQLVAALIEFFRGAELPFSFRLVVVDNNSSDGSQELLATETMPELVAVPANENLGYGRGMNRGLAAVASRYACIMNTDLLLNREALLALWEFFQTTPDAGVAAPLIMGVEGRQQGFIFHPGILSLYSPLVCKLRSKCWKKQVEAATAPCEVPGVMGAFFMIRRDCCPSSDLFDRDFFFYYEDTELAHRLWSTGIKCYVLPKISIVHLGGQSTSAAGAKLFQAGRRLYITKVHGPFHAALLERLDHVRLYGKFLKYLLLVKVLRIHALRSKYDFYARSIAPGQQGS